MEDFSISCSNLPKIFFEDKNVTKNHFRQFGRIKKIIFKPKSGRCTIEYATQEAVQKAIDFGCMYENHIFEIVREKKFAKRKKVKRDDDPEWVPDPDVLEELNAMGGGAAFGIAKKYNLRPEVMDVAVSEEKPKTILKRQWPISEMKDTPKKSKAAVSVPRYSLSDEQLELVEIIKKPAHNIDDEYKALDARDKLIRFFLKRDGTKLGPTKGTCTDMCPEKERLLRVIQHQVSIYEQDPSKEMNPNLAVKQYSRSSADQEASLPHELRPVDVLKMTMSYLVHRIMNLGDSPDVNVGDWFHFLWDRTRSIRKDITQQELCSQGSAALVEQCARFHIHCSARLVSEDPSVFDQKINTENLTKCLQTLKYMYNDLRLKEEECPNEAEFRAYIILLNLNDGNFMWEVQKLRPEIQKSKEVKDAIEIYSALDKNNFVKFFKLVNSATYLNACILMRYFMQVRIRAITILLKCYTPRITKVVYPLDELTTNLAFESVSHTIEFLQSCGLTVNASQMGVILDRNMFTTPDFTYTSLDRSINIVESKRKDLSVGQIVCGGTLPPKDFESHVPQNSFNDKGVLKLDQYCDLQDLMKTRKLPMKVEKNDNSLKTPTNQTIFKSPKVKNPYVYVNDTQEIVIPPKSSKTEKNYNIGQKIMPIFPPVKTSIFSLDNRKKVENSVTLKTNIFGGQTIKDLPVTDDMKFVNGSTKATTEQSIPKSNILQSSSKNIFETIPENSKNIFGNVTKASESLFGDKKDTQAKTNIFGGSSIQPKSINLFGQIRKSEENLSVPTASIFGNKCPISENQSNIFGKTEAVPSNDYPKDETDFKEIKWDLDSPEKEKDSQNTLEDIFFKPPTSQTSKPVQNVAPKSVGGFSFPDFTFTKKDENNIVSAQLHKEQSEKEIQDVLEEKEKERKQEEERKRIEKEKQERIRKLEIEREIARKKRKEEEERVKKLREEQEREMENRKMKEISTTITKLIPEILEKVETQIRSEKVEELKKNKQRRILLELFQIWRKTAIKMKKKRKAIECSPVWICSRSPQEEAAELRTESQNLTLKDMKRYKLGKPLQVAYDDSNVTDKIDFKELSDIISRRYYDLGMKFFKEIYWKCVISLPGSSEMPDGRGRIEETLQQFLQWKNSHGETVLLDKYSLNQVQSIKYCIEKQSGLDVECCDANGFIFIAKSYNQDLCRRILENFKDFGVFVRIPIVIILQEPPPNSINFKILIEEGIISNYLILVDNLNPKKLVSNVDKGLRFLVQNAEKPPPVQLDTMKAFLIRNLCSEIWKRASSFSKWNSVYKKCLKNPKVVIDLYNDALKKLKEIILNKSCYEFAQFPAVFRELLPSEIPDSLPCDYKYFPAFCKKTSYFNYISGILKKLELKPLKTWPPKDQIDLEIILSEYISESFQDPQKPFYKTLAVFLKQIETTSDFQEVFNVMWTDVVEILATEKIKQISFSLEGTEYFNKSVFNQLVVVYDPEALTEYTSSDWFYVNHPIIRKQIEENSYLPRKVKEQSYTLTSEEIDEAISKARSKMIEFNHADAKNELKEFKYLMSDLEESLIINRKIASGLNKRLMTIVEDEK